MALDGYYRGTDTKVNTNDIIGREHGITTLKDVFNWDLKSNPKKYKIDLNHVNRRGGVDVEEGKWKGRYKDQNAKNFNKFTMKCPTANFPMRKKKYFEEHHQWVTDKGGLKSEHTPDYEYNSLLRFNVDFTEFFFIDYETYKKMMKQTGCWRASTVYKVDGYGNPVIEYWMCWELKDVPFYFRENGIWVRDMTFDDSKVYDDYVEKYRGCRLKNKELQKIT